MSLRPFALALALILCSGLASAAQLKSPAEALALAEQITKKASEGDIPGAFALAAPYSAVSQAEIDAMQEKVSLQLPVIAKRFGKNVGYEFLRKEEAGSSLLLVKYLQRLERHVLVWSFYFYRTETGWELNSFKFVDDVTTAFR